ncbi:MAG TPA: PilZ domain-containing protein [Candidatus Acidoferrum sp.]
MSQPPKIGAPAANAKQTERRTSRRCRITQLMRLRPSDPEKDHFDDLRGTLSVSRTGVYFQTTELGYELGMRLFVTMPYSQQAAAMSREYLAEVVRKDALTNGMTGIGFKILMEMGMQPNFSYSFSGVRK